MNFFIRFFVGYVIVTAVAVLLAMKLFTDQFVPGVRQSVEETLVQTANLLAEVAARESARDMAGIATLFRAYERRRFDARIYGVLKNDPDLRVYVTDQTGRVVYDSRDSDVGQDYSRWLDVSRTLRGEYGARTTREHDLVIAVWAMRGGLVVSGAFSAIHGGVAGLVGPWAVKPITS